MAKDIEDTNLPPVVPYFDPQGVYKAVINYEIVQHGRMEEQGSSGKMEYVAFATPVHCGGADNIHYDTLPMDGAQVVTIVMIKALQDIQVGGMITRTPIGDENSPDQAKFEAMLATAQRPTLTPEQLEQLKALLSSK